MGEFDELYQEMILDHKKKPRNFKAVDDANHRADGFNPLCGDKLKLFLKVDDGKVTDVGFQGEGCAISTASASMMTEALLGKSEDEAHALFTAFHGLVMGEDDINRDLLGKLEAFEGVRAFPMRVKCATLAWHTLEAALKGEEVATTE